MTDLGARLKEARLAKGLSLEDLQEVTKIQKRYLVGIEEGNYGIMPGAFYVRAFIKQYAEAVGLDPEELLLSYQHDIPGVKHEEVSQAYTQTKRRRLSARSSNKMLEIMPMLIAALFIIVIIVFSWYLYQQKLANKVPSEEGSNNSGVVIENKNVTTPPEKDETETGEEQEEEPQQQEEPEKEVPQQVVTQTEVNGLDVLFDVTNTTDLKIRVEIVDNSSWVAFRNTQGVDQLGKEYLKGQSVEYDATADRYVRIRLGRQNAVKVFVNDEEITSPSNEYTQNYIIQFAQQ